MLSNTALHFNLIKVYMVLTDLPIRANGSCSFSHTFLRSLVTLYNSFACGWYTSKTDVSDIPIFRSKADAYVMPWHINRRTKNQCTARYLWEWSWWASDVLRPYNAWQRTWNARFASFHYTFTLVQKPITTLPLDLSTYFPDDPLISSSSSTVSWTVLVGTVTVERLRMISNATAEKSPEDFYINPVD